MSDVTISISDCNSIEKATIKLLAKRLNIKYGPNGIGKSTMAKAIKLSAENDLSSLTPFKSQGVEGAALPKIEGAEAFQKVLLFDEEFVGQFVFQRDEIVRNSFDIFIKTAEYDNAMANIDNQLSGIRNSFNESAEISKALVDLKELRDAMGKPNNSTVPKNSKIQKAFGDGNKVENIPDALKPFERFIKSDDPATWISWQIKGNKFVDIADNCPYCSANFAGTKNRATAKSIEQEYDAKSVEHLSALLEVISRLDMYFTVSCQEELQKILKSKISLSKESLGFLSKLKIDIETLISKLESLRSISFFSLRDVDVMKDRIEELKIDIAKVDYLNSDHSRLIVDPINAKLDELLSKVGTLQGGINMQKSAIRKTIESNQKSINDFLKAAGYKYSVQVVLESETYKMKLIHSDKKNYVDEAAKHLSYGERNAFALVLFMYHALKENPDIVVLDDPISSFDRTKKFAIMNQLFRGKDTLQGKTVLMLTHDIEPAIDMVKSTPNLFSAAPPLVTFLSARNGTITERNIQRGDIQTFAGICKKIINSTSDSVIKCIYLRRRYEIDDEYGLAYNLLANLFHKRQSPVLSDNSPMTNAQQDEAVAEISKHIPEFNYSLLLQELNDESILVGKYRSATVGYEKLQLFRLIYLKPNSVVDDIVTKFINESFHVENEYIMQLNPQEFDPIPEYIIAVCTNAIDKGYANHAA